MLTTKFTPLEELQLIAKEKLDQATYDYIAGGAGSEWGIKNNRDAFHNYQLVPRLLQNVSDVDMSIQMLDVSLPCPIIIGPSSFHKLVCPEGEVQTARASEKIKTIMTLSTMSSCSIEEVAKSNNAPKWFQLYIFKNLVLTENLVKRAEKSGYKALVLTVDVPVMGNRWRDIKNKFSLPSHIDAANLRDLSSLTLSDKINGSKIKEQTDQQFESNLTWETIDWLCSITKLPILLKGILHPEDASEALKHNIAGIIVSNHGGRQLDSVIAPIDALPEIRKVIKNKIPILVDGGIRSGEDIFKALALGADAVLIARPVLWSLAIGGEKKLISTFENLQNELILTMRLTGCPSIKIIKERGLSLLAGPVSSIKIFNSHENKNKNEEHNIKKLSLFKS